MHERLNAQPSAVTHSTHRERKREGKRVREREGGRECRMLCAFLHAIEAISTVHKAKCATDLNGICHWQQGSRRRGGAGSSRGSYRGRSSAVAGQRVS